MQEIGLQHLNRLTDDFGIWQHTKGDEIDTVHGYALDDAARGLLSALEYQDEEKIDVYLKFLRNAITRDHTIIFFDKDRNPLPIECSEDALAEAYWAVSLARKGGVLSSDDEELIKIIDEYAKQMTSIRGRAYSILGAINYNPKLAKKFASEISAQTVANSSGKWFWPENVLTYGNAIIPYSLLAAAERFNDRNIKKIALKLLTFLNDETKVDGIPIAIGNEGWCERGGGKSIFSQQPIDPAYQVIANVSAWKMTGNKIFLQEAEAYFSWFWGGNLTEKSLINVERESVYDSLEENSVRINQGAENIVCYLLAQQVISPYLNK